jgi:hypothetical protein
MLGFPTAFTLMGLGMMFGFVAFYDPGRHLLDNRIFDLMVQRAFGAMNNDTLLSIPLFVLMGYVMERGALVDKMFHSVQLAFRKLPGLAGRHHADHLHLLGHRLRAGRRGGGADGRDRDAARCSMPATTCACLRRDHRRRHAGHPDPAVGDDHRATQRWPASRS